MSDYPTIHSFEQIILEEIPLIDVRAPVEFADGAFPTAINLPLMNDEERKKVGICYKHNGNEAAVKLGHKLVSGALKQERVDAWVKQIEKDPNTLIYCFRGGMRSQIAQQWVFEQTGKWIPRLEGGYKAFRRYLMDCLEPSFLKSKPVILGGRTGAGKTILLRNLSNFVDLEAIANHRGSSFGRFTTPQPTPINFENSLAWAFIHHKSKGFHHMILEDEGRNVGDRYLPKPLVEHFSNADLVILERSMQERIEITFDEYVVRAQFDYQQLYGEGEGSEKWLVYMESCLDRIRKRLGGLRHKQIKEQLQLAHKNEDPQIHKSWIEQLLSDYYDPMYDYQIQNKSHLIVFKGREAEVLAYLNDLA